MAKYNDDTNFYYDGKAYKRSEEYINKNKENEEKIKNILSTLKFNDYVLEYDNIGNFKLKRKTTLQIEFDEYMAFLETISMLSTNLDFDSVDYVNSVVNNNNEPYSEQIIYLNKIN